MTPTRKAAGPAAEARHLDALRQATGALAHGLNNRLTAIAGFLDLARDSVKTGRSPAQDLDAAVEVVMNSAQQVAKLLAFASRGSLVATRRDLARLIRALTRTVSAAAGEQVQVTVDLDPETGAVAIDAAAFQTVLMALAANAREAMPVGGMLTLRSAPLQLSQELCDERFPMLEPGRYAEVSVTDTGLGMDRDVRGRCFDPYFSTHGTPAHIGLGLSTCYGIMRQLSGMIEIESAPDEGTLVRLLLPRVESDR